MTHLVIAGHGIQRDGSFDPGASGYIKKGEHKYVVEDLFPSIKKHLPKGHNVVLFHAHKVSNYGDLVSLVKKHKATKVTEIHFDAHTLGSSASGGHVIIHKNFDPDKLDLALRDAIKNMVGVRYNHKGHEGISGRDNLYNVNIAAQNGINYRLIELGFGTNKRDADILVNKVDQYAKELVKAIVGKVNDKPSNNTTSKPKPPTNPTPSQNNDKLAVDGYWGPATTRALQRYFGTPVDGYISKPSLLIKAMQKWLGTTQDGYISEPYSLMVVALQKRFGTPQDGYISKPSLMVKEMQRRLNNGKL